MAIWLIRAGSHGEYEQKFIQENRAAVTPNATPGKIDARDGQPDQATLAAAPARKQAIMRRYL